MLFSNFVFVQRLKGESKQEAAEPAGLFAGFSGGWSSGEGIAALAGRVGGITG